MATWLMGRGPDRFATLEPILAPVTAFAVARGADAATLRVALNVTIWYRMFSRNILTKCLALWPQSTAVTHRSAAAVSDP